MKMASPKRKEVKTERKKKKHITKTPISTYRVES